MKTLTKIKKKRQIINMTVKDKTFVENSVLITKYLQNIVVYNIIIYIGKNKIK